MSTYLLLRNNKESGPHTLQALLTIGLRPYDLVWVEGRSAAWRYPSEVEELKPYAEAVEEQPFDRFYKKNDSSSLVGVNTDQQHVHTDQHAHTEKSLVEVHTDQHEKYMPPPADPTPPATRKSVFVTMPGKAVTPPRPAPSPRPVTSLPVVKEREPEPVETEIKYSQSLDDIKDMYVQTLQDRKKKQVRRSQWRNYLRTAAVIAGLIGVGVLVGFMVRPRSAQSPVLAEKRSTGNTSAVDPVSSQSIKEETVADQVQLQNEPMPAPEKFKDAPLVNVSAESRLLTRDQGINNLALHNKTPEFKKNNNTSSLQSSAAPEASTYPVSSKAAVYQSTTQDPHTGERGKAVRNVNTPVTEQAAVNTNTGTISRNLSTTDALAGQVAVRSNDYKRVAFGGIRDLRLTVTNNSNFELDQVLVELQYIKPSEEPLRTEQIRFGAIAANESSTVRIPDTNRGIKVTYRIIKINSKQAQDALAGR